MMNMLEVQRPVKSGSRQAPDPIDTYLESRMLYRKHAARDASCLFRTIAEQMYDTQSLHYEVRLECVRFMTKKRRIFEKEVNGDYDSYVLEMAKPKTYGTILELRAMCCLYRHNVILYEAFNVGTTVTFDWRYRDNFRIFYTNENHFDSVYILEQIKSAAVCQSLAFSLLYKMVFRLPDIGFAVETMLYPFTFQWGSYDMHFDDDGYPNLIRCFNGLTFHLDRPERTKCVLQNHMLCNFHSPIVEKLQEQQQQHIDDIANEKDKLQIALRDNDSLSQMDNDNNNMSIGNNQMIKLCQGRLISCVRQLLDDGITPFPYKVAKSLDPHMYRNVEFDSWNDMRKEAKRYNVYSGDYNFRPGVKCYLEFQNEMFICHIQKIAKDRRHCIVYVEQFGKQIMVPYDSLNPLPPDEFRPWMLPPRRRITATQHHNPHHITKLELEKYMNRRIPKWKRAKLNYNVDINLDMDDDHDLIDVDCHIMRHPNYHPHPHHHHHHQQQQQEQQQQQQHQQQQPQHLLLGHHMMAIAEPIELSKKSLFAQPQAIRKPRSAAIIEQRKSRLNNSNNNKQIQHEQQQQQQLQHHQYHHQDYNNGKEKGKPQQQQQQQQYGGNARMPSALLGRHGVGQAMNFMPMGGVGVAGGGSGGNGVNSSGVGALPPPPPLSVWPMSVPPMNTNGCVFMPMGGGYPTSVPPPLPPQQPHPIGAGGIPLSPLPPRPPLAPMALQPFMYPPLAPPPPPPLPLPSQSQQQTPLHAAGEENTNSNTNATAASIIATPIMSLAPPPPQPQALLPQPLPQALLPPPPPSPQENGEGNNHLERQLMRSTSSSDELPADMETLRYFYNMGVAMHKRLAGEAASRIEGLRLKGIPAVVTPLLATEGGYGGISSPEKANLNANIDNNNNTRGNSTYMQGVSTKQLDEIQPKDLASDAITSTTPQSPKIQFNYNFNGNGNNNNNNNNCNTKNNMIEQKRVENGKKNQQKPMNINLKMTMPHNLHSLPTPTPTPTPTPSPNASSSSQSSTGQFNYFTSPPLQSPMLGKNHSSYNQKNKSARNPFMWMNPCSNGVGVGVGVAAAGQQDESIGCGGETPDSITANFQPIYSQQHH